MSLAATLSADGMRPASFLPAIKCSNCGDEIEIARMGDHVCSSSRNQTQAYATPAQTQHTRPTPPPLSNPYTMPSWSTGHQQYQPESPTSQSPMSARMPTTSFAPSPLAQTQSSPQVSHNNALTSQATTPDPLRATKLPLPPRINPNAGHNPFLAPSFPRSASPASPVLSVRSARSGSSNGSRPPALRSLANTISQRVRNRSPSPDLASNLDCAFPSFPASSSNGGSRPGTSNGRKTPNSDRAPSRAASRGGLRAERDPHGMTTGDAVVKRANTLKSKPYDAGEWQTDKSTPPEAMPSLPANYEELSLQRLPSNVSDRLEPNGGEQISRRPTISASRSTSPPPADFFEYRRRSNASTRRPARDAEVPAPLRIGNRSKTFPVDEAKQSEAMRNTPPPIQDDYVERGRQRRPSAASSVHSQHTNAHITNLPVRSSSRSRTRTAPRYEEAPPVPKPVQHYRHLSKHAPSESASSASSTSRSYSNTNSSEGPSPVGSAASSIDVLSPLSQANVYDRDERPRSERMKSAGYSTKREQLNPGLRAEQPVQRSPPPNFARPRPTNTTGAMQSMTGLTDAPHGNAFQRRPSEHQHDYTRRTPPRQEMPPPLRTDIPPAKQEAIEQTPKSPDEPWSPSWGTTSPPKKDDYDPYRARSPNPAARGRALSNASSIYQPETLPSMPPPPMPTDLPFARGVQRRNTSARPPCRGCKQIIEGKSVKAADGNLSGRWHKHCFNCQTCHQPFATADFYVINDLPYCKQHYHEKNGSLCAGCTRGIEGQYLETSARGPEKKYHPTCFTCHECRLILSNDYFEINGHPYCERHALAAMRGQARFGGNGPGGYNNRGGYGTPSGLHPGRRELMAERRTTKLMMM